MRMVGAQIPGLRPQSTAHIQSVYLLGFIGVSGLLDAPVVDNISAPRGEMHHHSLRAGAVGDSLYSRLCVI